MVRSLTNWFSRKPSSRALGPRRPSAQQRARLALEALEDRTVPTVLFIPTFGAETVQGSNEGMISPSVHLIFSGSSWTQQSEQALLNSVASILAGPYLSGLTQYGSDGKATLDT